MTATEKVQVAPEIKVEPAAKPMRLSGVSVIFDWGLLERGEAYGAYSQADIVDGYGHRLNEELDYENVRTAFIDTRRKPVRNTIERLKEVPDNFLPLFLSCDWYARERTSNASIVEFSGSFYKLAERICEGLSEWGRCAAFGHRVLRPCAVEPIDGKSFIRVKPFALNGPNADAYLLRLDKLGEDLGRAIGGYLMVRGEGLRK